MTPILIRARNASEWTGPTGNNTWLIPGRESALVDAGVGEPGHVEDVARALNGAPLVRVLVTHGHPDHVGGIPALRARWPSLLVVRGHQRPWLRGAQDQVDDGDEGEQAHPPQDPPIACPGMGGVSRLIEGRGASAHHRGCRWRLGVTLATPRCRRTRASTGFVAQ